VLQIRKLNFSYGDMQVLWDVDLDVADREIVTVLGANGAGKSTILRNVSRLVKPTSGTIALDGEELNRLQSHQVVERGVVQVPEARRIFPEMTVVENLRMGSFVKATRKDRDRNMERCFSLFPRLAERKGQLGGTMSGGEQQMLAIGRGLMARPSLMLLDEPTLGLAPLVALHMFELIRNLSASMTLLVAEQDVRRTLDAARRAYVIENGRVVLEGAAADLAEDPKIRQAYLGL
jgi:branched-chain amino acid transport system ATP-binding protein